MRPAAFGLVTIVLITTTPWVSSLAALAPLPSRAGRAPLRSLVVEMPVCSAVLPEQPAAEEEGDWPELLEVRHDIARHRARRRWLRRNASMLPQRAAESLRSEIDEHVQALADLEDLQRTLVRTAKSGALRQQRAARRAFREWKLSSRTGRDEFSN